MEPYGKIRSAAACVAVLCACSASSPQGAVGDDAATPDDINVADAVVSDTNVSDTATGDTAVGLDLPTIDTPLVDVTASDIGGTDLGAPPNDVVPTGDGSTACGVSPGPAGVVSGCYTELDCSPVCPTGHVANSATSPNFRITAIQITAPATLASSVINTAFNDLLSERTFLWGVSFDFTVGSIRTGAFNPLSIVPGPSVLGHLGDAYTYFAGDAPSTGGASATRWDSATGGVTLMGSIAAVTTPLTTTVRLPIFSGASTETEAFELPLNNFILHGVQLAPDLGCIGVAHTDATDGHLFNECSATAWYTANPSTMTPYGVLEADISVADAESIVVSILPGSPDLCSVISGEYATGMTCAAVAQSLWPTQPTTMVGASPAFHLVADFAAVAASVFGVTTPTDAGSPTDGSAADGSAAGLSTAGDPCTSDSMCDDPALHCDLSLSFGECTGTCTNNASQVVEGAECGGSGSTCLAEGDGTSAVSYCWHACTPTALSVVTGACATGFACTGWWYTHASGIPDAPGCFPFCTMDSQCATGLHCNPRALGKCLGTAPVTTALADGQPCDPTITTMVPGEPVSRNIQCRGLCFGINSALHEGVCGSALNLRTTTTCPDNPSMLPLRVTGDNIALCLYAPCITNTDCTAPLVCLSTTGGNLCEYLPADGGSM